jgi:cytochrome b subunit of formate dehydrogenase
MNHSALQTNMPPENDSRRRGKVVWFIIAETVAIVILLVAGTFIVTARPVDSTIMTALNVVMLAAAGCVATIPILFFAFAPILPRSRR